MKTCIFVYEWQIAGRQIEFTGLSEEGVVSSYITAAFSRAALQSVLTERQQVIRGCTQYGIQANTIVPSIIQK
jgi:hypothetical protein